MDSLTIKVKIRPQYKNEGNHQYKFRRTRMLVFWIDEKGLERCTTTLYKNYEKTLRN